MSGRRATLRSSLRTTCASACRHIFSSPLGTVTHKASTDKQPSLSGCRYFKAKKATTQDITYTLTLLDEDYEIATVFGTFVSRITNITVDQTPKNFHHTVDDFIFYRRLILFMTKWECTGPLDILRNNLTYAALYNEFSLVVFVIGASTDDTHPVAKLCIKWTNQHQCLRPPTSRRGFGSSVLRATSQLWCSPGRAPLANAIFFSHCLTHSSTRKANLSPPNRRGSCGDSFYDSEDCVSELCNDFSAGKWTLKTRKFVRISPRRRR